MKKGQKKRIWTKEQKLEIINKHLKDHVSVGGCFFVSDNQCFL